MEDQEESNQLVFSVSIKGTSNALDIRHDIEDEMEAKGLIVDGGGMGMGSMDIFVDYNTEEEKQSAIKIGKEIFKKYGLSNVKVSE